MEEVCSLARHVTSRHDQTRSMCRAHAFCCVELVEQHGSTRSSRRTRHVERVETWRDEPSGIWALLHGRPAYKPIRGNVRSVNWGSIIVAIWLIRIPSPRVDWPRVGLSANRSDTNFSMWQLLNTKHFIDYCDTRLYWFFNCDQRTLNASFIYFFIMQSYTKL